MNAYDFEQERRTLLHNPIRARFRALLIAVSVTSIVGCPSMPQTDGGGDATPDGDIVIGDAADVPFDSGPDVIPDSHPNDVPDVVDTGPSDAADAGDGATGCTQTNVLAGTSDFTLGGFAVGDIATRMLRTVVASADAGTPVPQDHVTRASGCFAFDLRRSFAAGPNSIAVLDPANLLVPRRTIVLPTVTTGADGGVEASNPHDIAVLSPTRAYVAQYNSPRLAIVDPTAGTLSTASVDLSPLADADGIPEAEAIAIVGTRAFVALQLLDRRNMYRAPANSVIAVVDTTTDRLIDTEPATMAIDGIRLSFGNPAAIVVARGGTILLVPSSGNFASATDGGVDVIDVTSLRVVRNVPSTMLGGEPEGVEWLAGPTAWVTVRRSMGDAGSESLLLAFDYTTATLTATPVARSTTFHFGLLRRAPDGNVWMIGGGFASMGFVNAFTPLGTPLAGLPFMTPGMNTVSLDFVP